MSFGWSANDIVKLLEYSVKVYDAFASADNSSQAQVSALVREFSALHGCLKQLGDLMIDYDRPLPLPYLDLEQTLKRCQKTIQPYEEVMKGKMGVKKILFTIKFIGKESEIESLRTRITGHYQALHIFVSFLQLQSQLEATKQTQRLLDLVPTRSYSLGGRDHMMNAIGSSTRIIPNALPAPSDVDQLYKDWLQYVKREDERLAIQNAQTSTSSQVASEATDRTAAMLYHLKRELEDVIVLEDNRSKRRAAEERTSLPISETTRDSVRNLPQIRPRTFLPETEEFGASIRFDDFGPSLSDSAATIKAGVPPQSHHLSPQGSPQIPSNWSSPSPSSDDPLRSPSIYSSPSSVGTQAGGRLSANYFEGITADPTLSPTGDISQRRLSAASMMSLLLGPGALKWDRICRRVRVERKVSEVVEERVCDVYWRYDVEDGGISLRSIYRSSTDGNKKTWVMQRFPATGPSIPLATSHLDGDTSIEFPRRSFGRLEKGCTDVKYSIPDTASSKKLQTLLYTDDGKDAAELLFDRPVRTIRSNLNKPECIGKNVKLWRKSETRLESTGIEKVDILILLFYTSALDENRGHWVEEPHYAFQPLDESVYKKSSDELTLTTCRETGSPGKRMSIISHVPRNSSRSPGNEHHQGEAAKFRRPSSEVSVWSMSTASIMSAESISGRKRSSGIKTLNRYGYTELEFKFVSKKDRQDFCVIWKDYTKVTL